MPLDFGPKQLKLKRGDVQVRTRGSLIGKNYYIHAYERYICVTVVKSVGTKAFNVMGRADR
jgi:hypothetical protein